MDVVKDENYHSILAIQSVNGIGIQLTWKPERLVVKSIIREKSSHQPLERGWIITKGLSLYSGCCSNSFNQTAPTQRYKEFARQTRTSILKPKRETTNSTKKPTLLTNRDLHANAQMKFVWKGIFSSKVYEHRSISLIIFIS